MASHFTKQQQQQQNCFLKVDLFWKSNNNNIYYKVYERKRNENEKFNILNNLYDVDELTNTKSENTNLYMQKKKSWQNKKYTPHQHNIVNYNNNNASFSVFWI